MRVILPDTEYKNLCRGGGARNAAVNRKARCEFREFHEFGNRLRLMALSNSVAIETGVNCSDAARLHAVTMMTASVGFDIASLSPVSAVVIAAMLNMPTEANESKPDLAAR